MGPHKAAEMFLARHPEATSFEVTLYGSLAATGRGHMTDVAIMNVHERVFTPCSGAHRVGAENLSAIPSERHAV